MNTEYVEGIIKIANLNYFVQCPHCPYDKESEFKEYFSSLITEFSESMSVLMSANYSIYSFKVGDALFYLVDDEFIEQLKKENKIIYT